MAFRFSEENLVKKLLIFLLLASLAFPGHLWAASSLYVNPGTAITFGDSGRTVAWTISNVAAANGNVSASYNKGTGAQPAYYRMQCTVSFAATGTLGQTFEYYYATSQDGTTWDAGVTGSAGSITSDQRRALKLAGVLAVYNTTSATSMTVSFPNIYIPTQYYALAFWNNTTVTTETSTTKHYCAMVPMVPTTSP